MVLRSTLDEVMGEEGDSIIPVCAPPAVVDKCNSLIAAALEDHGLPGSSEPSLIPALRLQFMERVTPISGETLRPMFWRIDSIRAWQLIDRRIDE